MKNIIIILLIVFSGMAAFAKGGNTQSADQAPFGGRIIEEKEPIIVFEFENGTQITKYSENSDWFLTKEIPGSMEKIPAFVKKQPVTIVYEDMEGMQFSTLDLKNWKKISNNPVSKKQYDGNIIEIKKPPQIPVFSDFELEFILKANADVNLTVTDIQGRVIFKTNSNMTAGYNKFEFDAGKLRSGTYIYKISAGNSFISKPFIKL